MHCLTPDRELFGQTVLLEPGVNLRFGDTKRDHLLMTGSQSMPAVYVNAIEHQRDERSLHHRSQAAIPNGLKNT